VTVQRHGEADDAFDPVAAFRLIQGLAEAHAARCGLTGEANDIAQEAFTLLSERCQRQRRPFDAEEAEKLVAALADAERNRRDAERRHLARAPRTAPPATPRLCRAVAQLADLASRPSAFRKSLARAARCLARDPKVLEDRQYRIYDLMWVAGIDMATATKTFGLSPRALEERLFRASRRIQTCLIGNLKAYMPLRRWLELRHSVRSGNGVAPTRELADAVLLGLGQVIHNSATPEIDLM